MFFLYMYFRKCLFKYPLMATEMVEAQIFKKWLKHYDFLLKILRAVWIFVIIIVITYGTYAAVQFLHIGTL